MEKCAQGNPPDLHVPSIVNNNFGGERRPTKNKKTK